MQNMQNMQNDPVYVKAMSLLALSDMSERRLREKLLLKGFSESEIGRALDALREKGYISDDRLIENLVSYYSRRKYFGRYRIKLELLSKFDRESVDRALDGACACVDFKELASEFAIKEKSKGTDREKLIRKLQRLGHDSLSIRYALDTVGRSEEK